MYDTSAFNVALGLAFGVDNTTYIEEPIIFECSDGTSEEVNEKLQNGKDSLYKLNLVSHNPLKRTKRSSLEIYLPHQSNFKPMKLYKESLKMP